MNWNVRDRLNLLSKLSPSKAWNAARVLSSYYFSRWIGRPVQWGLPIAVAIEPTTSCNLRCPECPSGLREFSRPTGMLEPSFFRKMMDEHHTRLWYLIFYFQGEP